MDENEFMKTNVNVACVVKLDLSSSGEFKKELLALIKRHGGSIVYHTVSPYKLIVSEDKREQTV